MNLSSQVLLDLIKCSLWGTELQLYSETVNWKEVFNESKLQSVSGLTFSSLPDYVPTDIQTKWKNYATKTLSVFFRVMVAQDALLTITREANIPSAILKGSAAAIYYPSPSKRTMGDIDLLVPQEMFDRANKVLTAAGYQPKRIDNDDRHNGFAKDGVYIELHHHFSHDDLDIENYLIDGFQHLQTCDIDHHEFPMFSSLENGLILLEHMREHIKSGLGLRQVIDWMMYAEKCLNDDFFHTQFKPVITDIGMLKFAVTITRMCQLFLGLTETITWCSEADPSLCEKLLESILSDGNMGAKTDYADNRIKNISLEIKREGLFHKLQKSGMHNWRAYHKHPWLKPFCWLYQIFRYIKQMFKSKSHPSQIKTNMSSGADRLALMEELEIK